MSNFTVNGVYSYTSSNIYSYLGRVPTNSRALERAFQKFNIRPTGEESDLRKLNNAMYRDYSNQVQEQINNQNNQNVIPWAGVCAQIGIQATGDHDKDYAAFNNAIQLLSQSAIDGQAMTYFAGLRSEASRYFNQNRPTAENTEQMSYYNYKSQFLY